MKRKRSSRHETLSPEVAAALAVLRPVPEPDAVSWEARRRAFLAEARQFSAEIVSTAHVVRRKAWKDLFSFHFKEDTMAALIKVVVAMALIFGMGIGTVSASQESLPGSVLYPVKLQYEDVRLATTGTGEAKMLLALNYAQRRVDEAVDLVERGTEIPEPVAARYQSQIGLAMQVMEGLNEAQQLQLRAHVSTTLQSQVRLMTQVMTHLRQRDNTEHPEVTQARLQTMLQTMQRVQQRLGGAGPYGGGNEEAGKGGPDGEMPGNTEAPGPQPNDNGNGGDGGRGDNGQCAGDCGEQQDNPEDRGNQERNGEDNGGGGSDSGGPGGAIGGGDSGGTGGGDSGGSGGGTGGSDSGGSGGGTGGGESGGSGSGTGGGDSGGSGGGTGGGDSGGTGGGDSGGSSGGTGGGDSGGSGGGTGGSGSGGSGSGSGGGGSGGGGH